MRHPPRPRSLRVEEVPQLQRVVASWIATAGRSAYDHVGEIPHRIYDNLRSRDVAALVHVWEQDDQVTGITIAGAQGPGWNATRSLGPVVSGATVT